MYLEPPAELGSPQMYMTSYYWKRILKDPIEIHHKIFWYTQTCKNTYLNTVPIIALLICNSMICGPKPNVDKWIAAMVWYPFLYLRVPIITLIWEHLSFTLKAVCPYCDPCDPLKTIPFQMTMTPNSKNELGIILE